MGVYYDLSFSAKINSLGEKILTMAEETGDWKVVAEYFAEYSFLTEFLRYSPQKLFSVHSSYEFEKRGFQLDCEKKILRIEICFKGWNDLTEGLKIFLPYVIDQESVEIRETCDHWYGERITKINQLPIPEPDWNLWCN